MRKYAIMGGVALLLLLVGYGFGRWTTPESVITIDKTEELTVAAKLQMKLEARQELEQEFNAFKQQFLAESKKKVRIHTVTTTTPDGKKVIDHKEDTDTEDKVAVNTEITGAKLSLDTSLNLDILKDDVFKFKKDEHTKIEKNDKPNWILGVTAGTDIRLQKFNRNSIIIGAEVDYRVIGPVFLGVWVNSELAAGIAARMAL